MTTKSETPDQRIVFFDGHCGLCHGFVDYLLRHDRTRSLKFAPLQGSTAERLLPPEQREEDTLVLYDRGKILKRSSGALEALASLGGLHRAARALKMIPAPIRDGVYDFIARKRYAWFGRRDECRWPGATQKKQEKSALLP